MTKYILNSLDYSNCAQFALVLFVVTFGLILYGSLRLGRKATDRFASIPLSDDVEDPRDAA